MKKIFFIILLLIMLPSCSKKSNNETNDEPKTIIILNQESVEEYYYVDEFDLSSIQLIKTIGEQSSTVLLKESMVDNCPSFDFAGTYNLTINYENQTLNLTIILKEKEFYTTGLEFALNNKSDAYLVIGYNGSDEQVVIPSTYNELPVKEIKANAFKGNKVVKEVIIPETLYKIGDNAFNSSSLRKIDLSKYITYIGNAAFYQCESLEEVKLNKSITYVGEKAFDNTKLIFIENKAKTTSWSSNYCNANTSFVYTNMNLNNFYVEGDFEFYLNDDYAELVNYLGSTNSNVLVPGTIKGLPVTIIGNYSIYNHLEITELKLPNSIQYIKSHGIQELSITSLTLPEELIEISEYGVACCRKMVELNFNNKLKKICSSAFSSSEELSVVKLPRSLEVIEGYAFQNCYKITSMYIPSNVTSIGAGCFYSNRLSKIYLETASIPVGFESGWNPSNRPITYSCEFGY